MNERTLVDRLTIRYYPRPDGSMRELPPCPLDGFRQCRPECAWFGKADGYCAVVHR